MKPGSLQLHVETALLGALTLFAMIGRRWENIFSTDGPFRESGLGGGIFLSLAFLAAAYACGIACILICRIGYQRGINKRIRAHWLLAHYKTSVTKDDDGDDEATTPSIAISASHMNVLFAPLYFMFGIFSVLRPRQAPEDDEDTANRIAADFQTTVQLALTSDSDVQVNEIRERRFRARFARGMTLPALLFCLIYSNAVFEWATEYTIPFACALVFSVATAWTSVVFVCILYLEAEVSQYEEGQRIIRNRTPNESSD